MAEFVAPPFEGGTVPGLEGGNGDNEGGAVRTVAIELPEMAGGEDTSAVDVMLTAADGSEVGIVTGDVVSTGTVKSLDSNAEEVPLDVDASLATGSRAKFDTEVTVAATAFGSDGAAVVAPTVVVVAVVVAVVVVVVVEEAAVPVLVGGVDVVPVVVAVVVKGTESGIDDGATEETEEAMLARVPLSVMARRV